MVEGPANGRNKIPCLEMRMNRKTSGLQARCRSRNLKLLEFRTSFKRLARRLPARAAAALAHSSISSRTMKAPAGSTPFRRRRQRINPCIMVISKTAASLRAWRWIRTTWILRPSKPQHHSQHLVRIPLVLTFLHPTQSINSPLKLAYAAPPAVQEMVRRC